MLKKLVNFLQSDLDVSIDAISLATKTQNVEPNILPIVLWQYGFLNIAELERVFDWLEVSQ